MALTQHIDAQEDICLWVLAVECPTKEQIQELPTYIKRTRYQFHKDLVETPSAYRGHKAILELMDEFLQQRRSVKGSVYFHPWEGATERIEEEAKKSCNGAIIVQLGSTWISVQAELGLLENLTDLIEDIGIGKYAQTAIEHCRSRDMKSYWAVPWYVDLRGWFYNRKIFEEVGLEAAWVFKNWENFENACLRIYETRHNHKAWPLAVPTAPAYGTMHILCCWIWGAGGELVDGQNAVHLSEQQAVDAISFLVNLAVKGYIPVPENPKNRLPIWDIDEEFLAGKYAMILTGPWLISEILRCEKEKDFLTHPLLPGPIAAYTYMGGSALGLLKRQECSPQSRQIAKELIRFLVSDRKAQAYYAACISAIPASIDDVFDEWLAQLSLGPKGRERILLFNPFQRAILAGRARSHPVLPEWMDIEEALQDLPSQIWEGSVGIRKRHVAGELEEGELNSEIQNMIQRELSIAQSRIEEIIGREPLKAPELHLWAWRKLYRPLHNLALSVGEKDYASVDNLIKACEEEVVRIRDIHELLEEFARNYRRRNMPQEFKILDQQNFGRELQDYQEEIQDILRRGRVMRDGPVCEELSKRVHETMTVFRTHHIRGKGRIIDNILSWIAARRPSVDSLRKSLDAVADEVHMAMPEKHGEKCVSIDKESVAPIVNNIVANSRLHNPDRKVTIRITLTIEGLAFLKIAFEDNGQGISSQKLQSICHRMPMGEGGLGIVYREVERWEGKVEVHSPGQNKGFTVTIKLPLAI